jgi:hypothetical protein
MVSLGGDVCGFEALARHLWGGACPRKVFWGQAVDKTSHYDEAGLAPFATHLLFN